jgi:gamma-aminobutyric acid type B receptor
MDSTLLLPCLLLALVSQSELLASAAVYNLEDPYPPENNDSRVPLYFSLIQSFSGQYISSYSLPGLQLALDLINEDETLLPGYSLHFVITDTPCNKIDALDTFHRQVFEGPTKIGIIGSGCSVSTEPTASISHYYNLVQVSCIASSPAFRDRQLFPRYFQLLPTDASLAITYMGLIEFYQWKRVAIIVQMENLFTVAMDELKVLLNDNSIEYSETELVVNEDGVNGGPPNSTIVNLDSVFDESSRIFIISTYEPLAREIICEAYRKGYRYPRHLFFMIPWYVNGWWRFEAGSYGCTVAEREDTLEYSMTVMNLPFAAYLNMSTTTDTGHEGTDNGRGMTVREYFDKVEEYLERPPLNVTLYDDVAPVCYDAMWTLALALNNTITEFETNISLSDLAYEAGNMPNRNETFRMENFTYQNDVVMETMFKHLEETDFLGVSGDVTFNEVGIRRVTQYLILQFRKNSSKRIVNEEIGVWSTNASLVYTKNHTEETTWPFGIPYDGVSVVIVINTVHASLTSVMIIFSTVGILFSAACLVFNFYFRNQTLIRLSSPNLNYLIGSGAILLYLAIIVTVLPADTAVFSSVVCNLRVWLTGFGYSLCYGTILVKMWRVYYIFSNPSTLKKAVSSPILMLK